MTQPSHNFSSGQWLPYRGQRGALCEQPSLFPPTFDFSFTLSDDRGFGPHDRYFWNFQSTLTLSQFVQPQLLQSFLTVITSILEHSCFRCYDSSHGILLRLKIGDKCPVHPSSSPTLSLFILSFCLHFLTHALPRSLPLALVNCFHRLLFVLSISTHYLLFSVIFYLHHSPYWPFFPNHD